MDRDRLQVRCITSDFKTRADTEKDEKIIEGYFIVFNKVTELWPGAFEEIAPEALDGVLGDIRALSNHDTRIVLGRTKPRTLVLTKDDRGLWGSIKINNNDTDALNLYARVERGDVDQCSFGFNITNEEVDWRDDGTVKWRITGIELHEVSVVTFPAYEDTSVQARQADYNNHQSKKIEQRKHALKERAKKWH